MMPPLRINTVNIYCIVFQIFSRYTYFDVLLTSFCNMEVLCPTFLLLIWGTIIYLFKNKIKGERGRELRLC